MKKSKTIFRSLARKILKKYFEFYSKIIIILCTYFSTGTRLDKITNLPAKQKNTARNLIKIIQNKTKRNNTYYYIIILY